MKTSDIAETLKSSEGSVCILKFLPGFLVLLLLALVSCGVESEDANSGQVKRNVTPVKNAKSAAGVTTKTDESKSDQFVEPGMTDRNDQAVSNVDRSKKDGESEPVPSEAAPERLQGLPDLSLLQEPDFQRRAKMGHLVAKKRCILCHKVDGRGAVLQPPLIQVSVRRLERMKVFPDHLEKMRQEDPNRYQAKKDKFSEIENEPDLLRKMSLWLHGYLKQPTFDNAQAKMPLQVLKPEEIDQLASYVIQLAIDGVKEGVKPPE